MKHISNLFAGATAEQYESMKARELAETRYMEWVYANRDADIKTCKAKYSEFISSIKA